MTTSKKFMAQFGVNIARKNIIQTVVVDVTVNGLFFWRD